MDSIGDDVSHGPVAAQHGDAREPMVGAPLARDGDRSTWPHDDCGQSTDTNPFISVATMVAETTTTYAAAIHFATREGPHRPSVMDCLPSAGPLGNDLNVFTERLPDIEPPDRNITDNRKGVSDNQTQCTK
jgi:hypothetical protein